MKKILLTWCGSTDLRASLGLFGSTGPILGALLADTYTDTIILGFEREKHIPSGINGQGELNKIICELKNSEKSAELEFLNHFSNTNKANLHYVTWLETEVVNAGKKVNVQYYPVKLSHLNDSQNIYGAAMNILRNLSKEKSEKQITFFLSPGTPVMSFVWVFASLKFPKLERRFISSSKIGEPPEIIELPDDCLQLAGRI